MGKREEVGILGKFVHHKYTIIGLRARKAFYEIHGDSFPRTFWNW
jgi:hypothetical protein